MQRRYRSVIHNKTLVAALAIAVYGTTGLLVPQESPKDATPRPVTVCELLKDLQHYRGRVVSVRGVYWYGLRQSCPEPFLTGGHVWPSALNLVDSEYPGMGAETQHLKTDQKSWDKLDELTMREAKAGRREEIWATIVGQLRAPTAYTREDGQVVGGYGHLGTFPAELVVESVSDILIRPRPTYDYRELKRMHGAVGISGSAGQVVVQ